jgi:hypothetical protein
MEQGDKFCPRCGAAQRQPPQPAYQQQQPVYQQPQQAYQPYQQPAYQQPYQQPQQQWGNVPAKIENYLVQSILVTLCCCIPFGIVAIIYASKVSNLVAQGNIAGAQEASRLAKMWCWIGFGIGIVVNCCSLLVQVLSEL